jgi:hypothetical protein
MVNKTCSSHPLTLIPLCGISRGGLEFFYEVVLSGSEHKGIITWILQVSSLPQMQGAGHAAVVYYRKCPATQQI